MGRKAKDSTTGWRQRYAVVIYYRQGKFETLLMRGRMRKSDTGELRALVSTEKYKGWKWHVLPDRFSGADVKLFEAAQRPEMVGHVSALRMKGYTSMNEVPSW